MKASDRYHKYVEWSDDDRLYIGYCPDLFPHGGVCHAESEVEAYRTLSKVVERHIAELSENHEPLPPVLTRPSRQLAFV